MSRNAVLIGYFYANQTSIAASCENKSKPQLNCNGKCILAKKLADSEHQDEEAFSKVEEVLSSKSYFPLLGGCPCKLVPVVYNGRYLASLQSWPRSINKPPSVVLA
ncbi:MAG: hypothetical protein MUF62_10175 [Chitinophagaceae bacterium]|nr:hypothetical protein [Chitinophagaceae bacterium]